MGSVSEVEDPDPPQFNVRELSSSDIIKYDKMRRGRNEEWERINFEKFPLTSGEYNPALETVIRITNDRYTAWTELFTTQRNKEDKYCDVHLIADDGIIRIHRIFLESLSPFIAERFKEACIPCKVDVISITLSDVKLIHLKAFMSMIYGGVGVMNVGEEPAIRNIMRMLQIENLNYTVEPWNPQRKRRMVYCFPFGTETQASESVPSSRSSSVSVPPRPPSELSGAGAVQPSNPLLPPEYTKVPQGTIIRKKEKRIQRDADARFQSLKYPPPRSAPKRKKSGDGDGARASGSTDLAMHDVIKVPPWQIIKAKAIRDPRIKRTVPPSATATSATETETETAQSSATSGGTSNDVEMQAGDTDDPNSPAPPRTQAYENDDDYVPSTGEDAADVEEEEVVDVSSEDEARASRPRTRQRTVSRNTSNSDEPCSSSRYPKRSRPSGDLNAEDRNQSSSHQRAAEEGAPPVDNISPPNVEGGRRTRHRRKAKMRNSENASTESNHDATGDDSESRPHKCSVCEESFADIETLETHLENTCARHMAGRYNLKQKLCNTCESFFSNYDAAEFMEHVSVCVCTAKPKADRKKAHKPASSTASTSTNSGNLSGLAGPSTSGSGQTAEPPTTDPVPPIPIIKKEVTASDIVSIRTCRVLLDRMSDEVIARMTDAVENGEPYQISPPKLPKKISYARRETENSSTVSSNSGESALRSSPLPSTYANALTQPAPGPAHPPSKRKKRRNKTWSTNSRKKRKGRRAAPATRAKKQKVGEEELQETNDNYATVTKKRRTASATVSTNEVGNQASAAETALVASSQIATSATAATISTTESTHSPQVSVPAPTTAESTSTTETAHSIPPVSTPSAAESPSTTESGQSRQPPIPGSRTEESTSTSPIGSALTHQTSAPVPSTATTESTSTTEESHSCQPSVPSHTAAESSSSTARPAGSRPTTEKPSTSAATRPQSPDANSRRVATLSGEELLNRPSLQSKYKELWGEIRSRMQDPLDKINKAYLKTRQEKEKASTSAQASTSSSTGERSSSANVTSNRLSSITMLSEKLKSKLSAHLPNSTKQAEPKSGTSDTEKEKDSTSSANETEISSTTRNDQDSVDLPSSKPSAETETVEPNHEAAVTDNELNRRQQNPDTIPPVTVPLTGASVTPLSAGPLPNAQPHANQPETSTEQRSDTPAPPKAPQGTPPVDQFKQPQVPPRSRHVSTAFSILGNSNTAPVIPPNVAPTPIARHVNGTQQQSQPATLTLVEQIIHQTLSEEQPVNNAVVAEIDPSVTLHHHSNNRQMRESENVSTSALQIRRIDNGSRGQPTPRVSPPVNNLQPSGQQISQNLGHGPGRVQEHNPASTATSNYQQQNAVNTAPPPYRGPVMATALRIQQNLISNAQVGPAIRATSTMTMANQTSIQHLPNPSFANPQRRASPDPASIRQQRTSSPSITDNDLLAMLLQSQPSVPSTHATSVIQSRQLVNVQPSHATAFNQGQPQAHRVDMQSNIPSGQSQLHQSTGLAGGTGNRQVYNQNSIATVQFPVTGNMNPLSATRNPQPGLQFHAAQRVNPQQQSQNMLTNQGGHQPQQAQRIQSIHGGHQQQPQRLPSIQGGYQQQPQRLPSIHSSQQHQQQQRILSNQGAQQQQQQQRILSNQGGQQQQQQRIVSIQGGQQLQLMQSSMQSSQQPPLGMPLIDGGQSQIQIAPANAILMPMTSQNNQLAITNNNTIMASSHQLQQNISNPSSIVVTSGTGQVNNQLSSTSQPNVTMANVKKRCPGCNLLFSTEKALQDHQEDGLCD